MCFSSYPKAFSVAEHACARASLSIIPTANITAMYKWVDIAVNLVDAKTQSV